MKTFMTMKTLITLARSWILIAIVISGFCFLLYGVAQQVLRQGADDPQIQIAEDTATKLAAGQQAQNLVPSDKVDIATSLAPYIIVFDATGKPIASSAQLNGQTPTIPSGIFDDVRQTGEDRITWEPQPGVRSAIVVTQVKGPVSGFVLAGRSLREVEKRENGILLIVTVGWIGLLFVSLLATAVVTLISDKLLENALEV